MQDAPQFRTNTLLLEGEREGGGRRGVQVHLDEFTIPPSSRIFPNRSIAESSLKTMRRPAGKYFSFDADII